MRQFIIVLLRLISDTRGATESGRVTLLAQLDMDG